MNSIRRTNPYGYFNNGIYRPLRRVPNSNGNGSTNGAINGNGGAISSVRRRLRARGALVGGNFAILFNRFADYIKNSFFDASFLILMGIAIFLMVSYESHDESIVKTVLDKMKASDVFKTFGAWVESNLPKFVGMIAFLPAVFCVAGRKQGLTILLSVVWIWLVPEHVAFEYIVQGILLYLFMKTDVDRYKLMIVICGIFFYFMQFGFVFENYDCKKIVNLRLCIRNCGLLTAGNGTIYCGVKTV